MIVFGKERDYVVHDDKNIKGLFGDYRFLSNFEECSVYFDGLLYNSTEAAYQSAKTLNMTKRKEFTSMRPNISMKAGRAIESTDFFRDDWKEVKYDIMSSVIFDKFYRNKDLRKLLLDTADKYLSEDNHWGDRYWGFCEGSGKNNLGKILMSVREFWKTDKINYKRNKLF